MRILAISDIHGSSNALKKLKKSSSKVDLIIIAGDITVFGNHIEEIMKKINSWNKKTLLITGNHEIPAQISKLVKKFKNIHFMNNKIMKIKNLLIYGYDTNGFSFKDSIFEKESKKFVKAIKEEHKKLKNKQKAIKTKANKIKKTTNTIKTILISHAPPYGTKADKIMDEHCGSKSVRDFCKKNNITYCFCGHLHEASHTVDKLKKTIVVNPGPYGMTFEI
jgi:uncharacterized protein